jgi:putative membrane protein
VVIVPLILITLSRALRERFDRHRAIARWTLPLWLYVSVTGVVVYWLLYIAYTPIWPAGFGS